MAVKVGVQEVVFSVFDIDRAGRALIDVCGFSRRNLPDASPEQAAAWHVPQGCTRIEQALLTAPDDERGALRLVAFHGLARQLIRPSQRVWDTGGIFDLDLFSKDVRGLYRRLQSEQGWTAFGEPTAYVIGEFDVTQVVAQGPDGLVLAVIQPHGAPAADMPTFDVLSRIFNTSQVVRDFDAAMAFYGDVLGWKPMMSTVVDDKVEPGADVLGLPMPYAEHCVRRVGIVHPTGSNDGSIELIQIADMQGHDYAERAVAPNVGLLTVRVLVEAARTYAAQIEARGGALYTPPMRLDIAPYGPVDLFSVRSPDGAIIEFYQPL